MSVEAVKCVVTCQQRSLPWAYVSLRVLEVPERTSRYSWRSLPGVVHMVAFLPAPLYCYAVCRYKNAFEIRFRKPC